MLYLADIARRNTILDISSLGDVIRKIVNQALELLQFYYPKLPLLAFMILCFASLHVPNGETPMDNLSYHTLFNLAMELICMQRQLKLFTFLHTQEVCTLLIDYFFLVVTDLYLQVVNQFQSSQPLN